MKAINFITENWEAISAVVSAALLLLARIVPTNKNIDLIGTAFKWLDKIIPNIKKGGGTHLILILITCLISLSANSQCVDNCNYALTFRVNADTTRTMLRYSGYFGEYTTVQNSLNSSTAILSLDTNAPKASLELYHSLGSNILNFDANGIEILTSEKFLLTSAKELILQAGNYSMTLEEVSGKTIIKAPAIPTTCTGQTSGTWANISGFLKVCP